MAISDLLGPDPLAQFEHEGSIDRILTRLRGFLPEGIDRREVLVLRSFVEEPPLSYWDEATVREVLDCLEQNISRTFAAIDHRSNSLHRGLENLHRESPTKDLQDAYDHGRARELLTLANSFLPSICTLQNICSGISRPLSGRCARKAESSENLFSSTPSPFLNHAALVSWPSATMTVSETRSPMGRLSSLGWTSNSDPNTQADSAPWIFFAFSTI